MWKAVHLNSKENLSKFVIYLKDIGWKTEIDNDS